MRTLGILALVGAVVLLVSPDAEARGGRHPYFNDQGTLTWYHTLAEAQTAARSENKLIFVEFGRLRCSQCRVLCNSILPDPRVRGRLSDLAVGLAADCDRPEPTVDAMFRRHLPHARMLPYAAFLTADGQYITGYGGSTSVDGFLAHLRKAEARRPRACAPCAAPKPAAPRAATPRAATPRAATPQPCEAPRPAPRPPVAQTPPVRPLAAPSPVVAATPEPPEPPRRVAAMPVPAPAPASTAASKTTAPALERAVPIRRRVAALPVPRPAAPPLPPVSATPPSTSTAFPPPNLVGSPDEVAVQTPLPPLRGDADGCAPPRRAPRTGPLPAPRIVISPPVRVARNGPAGRTQRTRVHPVARQPQPAARGRTTQARARQEARRAADDGRWNDVLATAADHPEDPVCRDLVERANQWAHDQLATAALDVREGRFEEGLRAVESVLLQMSGQPVAVDARRGLGAIQTMVELRYLNPEGEVSRTLRKNASDEYRGTRWASLF